MLAEDIPLPSASGGSADPTYTLLEGGDNYPDAFISRLSANDTSDVDNQVTRFIEYERNPQERAEWYPLGTGIASDEGSPSDRERCEWLRDSLLHYTDYTAIDQIYDPGATASQVKSALEEGRSIVNYLGHGNPSGWWATGFSNSDVNSLMNAVRLPFIISVACLVGQFAGGTCFCESWLRAGTVDEPRGKIAHYGSSVTQF